MVHMRATVGLMKTQGAFRRVKAIISYSLLLTLKKKEDARKRKRKRKRKKKKSSCSTGSSSRNNVKLAASRISCINRIAAGINNSCDSSSSSYNIRINTGRCLRLLRRSHHPFR